MNRILKQPSADPCSSSGTLERRLVLSLWITGELRGPEGPFSHQVKPPEPFPLFWGGVEKVKHHSRESGNI